MRFLNENISVNQHLVQHAAEWEVIGDFHRADIALSAGGGVRRRVSGEERMAAIRRKRNHLQRLGGCNQTDDSTSARRASAGGSVVKYLAQ